LHGGRVAAQSEGPGEGATFSVWFPSDPNAPALEPAPRADAEVSAFAQAPLADLNILVVDDDPDAREAIMVALRSAGAQAEAIDNVRGAVAMVGEKHVDVVVSDIGIPGEDGYSLIRDLRSRDASKRIAALALTAYASVIDQRRVLAAGYDAFLAKPAATNELIAAVLRVSRLAHRAVAAPEGR
jgi:CheY-like chemotaxis protein